MLQYLLAASPVDEAGNVAVFPPNRSGIPPIILRTTTQDRQVKIVAASLVVDRSPSLGLCQLLRQMFYHYGRILANNPQATTRSIIIIAQEIEPFHFSRTDR